MLRISAKPVTAGGGVLLVALALTSCQSTSATGGDTLLDAMGKGALAGLQEGLGGPPQQNPYDTDQTQTASLQQPNGESQPTDLAAQRAELAKIYGDKHADLIVQGHIDYGMTPDEVAVAWGDPEKKQVDVPSRGRQSWTYGTDVVVFTKGVCRT
jgi:hypothetical protein